MFQFHAARPPRPTAVPAIRAFPQPCGRAAALPRPLPPRPPPPHPRAAGGGVVRPRGEAEPPRGVRQGGGDGAGRGYVAAGGNAGGLVGGTTEMGSGGGGPDRKRGLLDFAAHPPPKRRAVSAKRQFPPGCGRDAPSLVLGDSDHGSSRLGAALSSGGDIGTLIPEQASVPPRPVGTGASEGCLRLEAAPANAADGGAPVSSPDGVEGVAGLVSKDRGRTAGNGELQMKASVPPRPACTGASQEGGLRLEAAPANANAGFGMPEKLTAADGATPVSSSDAVLGVASLVSKNRGRTAGNGELGVKVLVCRPSGTGGSQEGGLRLEAAPANACLGGVPEKVTAADAAAPLSNGYHHGSEAAVVASRSDGVAGVDGLVVKDRVRTAGSAELGMKELAPVKRPPPKRRMVSANRRFPPGCGRDVVVPLASGGGSEVSLQLEALPADGGLGALEAVVVATNGARSDLCAMDTMEVVTVSKNALDGIVEVHEKEDGEIPTEKDDEIPTQIEHVVHKQEDGEIPTEKDDEIPIETGHVVREQEDGEIPTEKDDDIPTKTDHVLQESQVTLSNDLHELRAGTHENAVRPTVAAKPAIRHSSNEKIHGNMLQRKGKTVSGAVAEDVKVINKSEGSSPKVATKPSAEGPPKDYPRDKKVSESYMASLNVAAGVQGQGIMRSKVTFTARKAVQLPVEANHKPRLVNLDRPYSTGKETQSVATMRESLVPRKMLKVIGPVQNKHLPVNVASKSALPNKEKLKDKGSSALEDDDIWKAISSVPSIRRHMQHGGQAADSRSKVRMICRQFQFICRTLVQDVEQRSVKSSRVDLAADKIIRKFPDFTKHGPIVGKVPGVEIGDEFLYRVELAIVGLHRPYQGGIDTTKDSNDTLIAISIVASGGYPDELSSSGEVIYTGSGGKPAGKKENEDQKLVRGNLALKNCINTKTPVRVIHGFKGPNREEGSHSKAKEVSTFTYDGLYNVVESWQEGLPGSRVFKYRLQRIPGQPELPLHVAKGLRKSVVRPGLCIADISQGKEKTPICVINNIDNARPTSFKYITRNRGPSLTAQGSQGCDCTDGCSNSATCTCIVKNGGEIPFNFNGAVVHAKPLIFECGPSCKCPPSCHNRVSQLGMKIPLEVFRTAKTGWGVRSLRSISAGSFICEYVGELLHGEEANQRSNDEYLFDIGQNYDIWKEMPSAIPGLNSSGSRSLTMEDDEGFTIDAAEYGNIGRFINHSCSPNLYAQNVLWDHDDKRVPHIMLFADENISPLQELTYDYNYEIGHVQDLNGGVKVKYCHCGSPQCHGRLY